MIDNKEVSYSKTPTGLLRAEFMGYVIRISWFPTYTSYKGNKYNGYYTTYFQNPNDENDYGKVGHRVDLNKAKDDVLIAIKNHINNNKRGVQK